MGETDLWEAPQSSATEELWWVSHTAAADRTETGWLAPNPEQISDWNGWGKKTAMQASAISLCDVSECAMLSCAGR